MQQFGAVVSGAIGGIDERRAFARSNSETVCKIKLGAGESCCMLRRFSCGLLKEFFVVQESRKKKKTIEQLDEKLRVMDAFFFAIGKYKSHAVAATNTAGKFAPRYTHLQTVWKRKTSC